MIARTLSTLVAAVLFVSFIPSVSSAEPDKEPEKKSERKPDKKPAGGGPRVIGPIVGRANDPPPTPEQVAGQVIEQHLLGDDPAQRDWAASYLAQAGEAALPPLREAAKREDLDEEVKRKIELIVGRIEADKKGREFLDKHLEDLGVVGGGGREVLPVVDADLDAAFPDHLFYVLRFRQFPVAFEIPEGFKASNVFAVKPGDQSVVRLDDPEGAREFFAATLAPVKDEASAKVATRAWLRVSQEWRQDGFYRFAVPDDSLQVRERAGGEGGLKASGKAVAAGGGNEGEVTASLAFDARGKLTDARDGGEVREGVRPICQATKLLDGDPVVRGMAEQSIRVMGRTCKPYLDEQRAKAAGNPELQAAIDRAWHRIVEEGR